MRRSDPARLSARIASSSLAAGLLLVACSSGDREVSTQDRSQIGVVSASTNSSPSTAEPGSSPTIETTTPLPPTTATTEAAITTDLLSTAAPIVQLGPGRPIEAIDPVGDPTGWRRALPDLSQEPSALWRLRFPRYTLANPTGAGDVVIHVAVTPKNEQMVVAQNKSDGSASWTQAIAGFRVANIQIVGGVVVVEWNAPGNDTVLTGTDPESGEELWRETNRAIYPEVRTLPNFIDELDRAYASEATALDPRTLEPVGTHQRLFVGPRGPLRLDGPEVFELDPKTLDVIDSVRLDREVDDFEALTIVPLGVVAYEEGDLLIYNRNGQLQTQLPVSDAASPQLIPTGPDSNVVVASFEGEIVGLDIAASTITWVRSGFLAPVGRIDGEQYAMTTFFDPDEIGMPADPSVEVFSMLTGESRCVIDEPAAQTRQGFFGESGTAYDLDCSAVWRLDVEANTSMALVDGGVLTWQLISDEIELTFYG